MIARKSVRTLLLILGLAAVAYGALSLFIDLPLGLAASAIGAGGLLLGIVGPSVREHWNDEADR